MDALIRKVDQKHLKQEAFDVRVGDTVRALLKVKEGTRERVQTFQGVVMSMTGASMGKNIKIRKISHGVGVEKTIPLHSVILQGLEIVKRGKARRARLFYLRERIGKMALYVRPLAQKKPIDGKNSKNSKTTKGKV